MLLKSTLHLRPELILPCVDLRECLPCSFLKRFELVVKVLLVLRFEFFEPRYQIIASVFEEADYILHVDLELVHSLSLRHITRHCLRYFR